MTDASGSDKINLKSEPIPQAYLYQICRSCLREVHKDYFWLESYYFEKKIIEIYRNATSIEVTFMSLLLYRFFGCLKHPIPEYMSLFTAGVILSYLINKINSAVQLPQPNSLLRHNYNKKI